MPMVSRTHQDIAFVAGRWPLDPDRPTLIFIHGSGQEARFWEAQVKGLLDVANTIAVDLPGHGRSKGEGFCEVIDYTRWSIACIAAMALPDPIPCGLSLGGAIVLRLLLDHGHAFRAGILSNTGARLKVRPAIIETAEKDYEAYLEEMIDDSVAPKNHSDQTICRKVLAVSTAGPLVTANDFRACDAFDVMSRVADISLPTLVLSAEHDVLTPVKYGQWLATNIGRAHHVCIAGAGHMSPVERPADFNAAIDNFLRRL